MKFGVILFIVAICIGYSLYDDFDPSILKGKNVIITGASTGIGEHLAYRYATMGANVLITARSEDKLKKVIKRCKELGSLDGQYLYQVSDMSDLPSTKDLIEFAKSKLGGIDYLVLNHITLNKLDLWTGAEDNFTVLHRTIEVNFKAYVHLASHAMLLLEKTNGSIVVVSSVGGYIPQPFLISYAASKSAVNGFFAGLRQELRIRDLNISVTLCTLGFIETPTAIEVMSNKGTNQSNRITRWVKMENVEDTAYAIIRGGAMRVREVYYPYLQIRPLIHIYNWAPFVIESVIKFLYTFD